MVSVRFEPLTDEELAFRQALLDDPELLEFVLAMKTTEPPRETRSPRDGAEPATS